MPELPEVETVVRGLNEHLVGHTIKSFDFDWPKTIKTPLEIFKKEIEGSKVITARRRGKLIIINLSSEHSILIHLKMTGQLVYKSSKLQYGAGHPNNSLVSKLPDKTTRIHFKLDNNSELFFNDVRKFGWVELIPSDEHHLHKFISSLGPEPLEIDYIKFKQALYRFPKAQIKAKLLDQNVLAGVGNIYADESLWAAQIHPQKKISEIPESKLKNLFTELQAVLNLSIEKGGSSSVNYIKVDGKVGSYLTFANVYKREGKPCKRCGTELIRTVAAGRGTRICPKCQKI
ncbi:MAG TPA: bifunctional DNA-formamidopyrimidine glycosylase/DNA-(apurinic or apyrimidinic site) lyase [Candidatus Saccharimonadales bacterium]|nr:bifunctional DNA-formamidopyrimidine glycosylase/DNA-(apurinic or apyrimidinic site) lyase [Candidatus Saccharimonadales bacterium]